MPNTSTANFSKPDNKPREWPWVEDLYPEYDPAIPWPRISIVTPSFNQGEFLEETIRSVLFQGYPNLEYIIMDGGSTDNSVEIIRSYSDRIAYWTSEKDQGQTDAIKRGFDRAQGDLLGWLNSDDIYFPEALVRVARQHLEHPEALILGAVQNFITGPVRKIIKEIQQENITLENFLLPGRSNYSWHQPGVFFPRSIYNDIGGLDPRLHYGMDHDLMCRFLINNADQVIIKEPIAGFRVHTRSKTSAQNIHLMAENYRIRMRYWNHLPENELSLILGMKAHFLLRAIKLLLKGNFKDAWISLGYCFGNSLRER